MARITHKGNPVDTVGSLPALGTKASDFLLTKEDLSDVGLSAFAGKKKILNIFPSLDTGVCSMSMKKFNESIKKYPDAVVLNVSNDTPFAHKRFCAEHHIDQAISLSNFRRGDRDFGRTYGVTIATGLLAGALSRAVIVVDRDDKVVYVEQVPEIAQEPDYEKALAAL